MQQQHMAAKYLQCEMSSLRRKKMTFGSRKNLDEPVERPRGRPRAPTPIYEQCPDAACRLARSWKWTGGVYLPVCAEHLKLLDKLDPAAATRPLERELKQALRLRFA